MATDKHRITISLSTGDYTILRRLAALQRAPMSRIVSELVAEMAPVLGRVVETMEVAVKAQESVKVSIRQAVDRAEATILPHAEAVMRQYREFDDELVHLVGQIDDMRAAGKEEDGAAGAPAHGAPSSLSGVKSPRPVTTGATKGQRRPKTGSKGRGTA